MATDDSIPPDSQLLGEVVGKNFSELRKQRRLTQDEASNRLRSVGLMWGRSQIAALEAGNREDVPSTVLVLLAEALDAKLGDLAAGEGYVRLTSEVTVRREWLRARWGSDGPSRDSAGGVILGGRAVRALMESLPGEKVPFGADADLARRRGVPVDEVSAAAERLWGRTLHQERDRRVAEFGDLASDERRIRRGHVTRELARELEPHLHKGDQ